MEQADGVAAGSMLPGKGATEQEISACVDAVLAGSTLGEKVAMLSGRGFFRDYREDGEVWGARPYRAGSGHERFGIPPLYFTDGPRGVARNRSTCFPCTMARGASFDADLEHRIGQAMGIEVKAQGCTLSGAVCMNLLRHPAWGRAQETYGEDSWHLGQMGAALGTGIQTHNVIATVKHFALNSIENARFKVDVRIDERALHEVYLPHFKIALDAGVASVMSAYNRVNGEYSGQNRYLLSHILRAEWGFEGFVHSDWVRGVYSPYGVSAGLDIENPEPLIWGDKLLAAVEGGLVEPQAIDTACRRILSTQFRFMAAEDPLPEYPAALVAGAEHCGLALEAAEKSAVLLENSGILPFSMQVVRKLAVLGRLAAVENTGDNGSSRVRPPYCVTALQGLRAYLGDDGVSYVEDADAPGLSGALGSADAIVVVVGYTAMEEGEFIPGDIPLGEADLHDQVQADLTAYRNSRPRAVGGDRASLDLPAAHVRLIEAAARSGKPVVVVIVAGSAVMVEGWRTKVGAILQTFYAGMEGGTALARLLFGDVNPSGKLPFTVARQAADYPEFDRDADAITYGYWHGYTKFDREGIVPRYAFGHGLSYTEFSYRGLRVQRLGGDIEVSVAVRNDGARAGDEVVQIYIGCPDKTVIRPLKLLRGFDRVSLAPGQTRVVRIRVPLESLRWRDPKSHCWRFEHGRYRVLAGGSSMSLLETVIEL